MQLLAFLPILLSLVLLVVFKVSSLRTAVVGYLLTVSIALIPSPFHTSYGSLESASLKGVFVSLIVIYVLVFGLLLYNLLKAGGAIQAISHLFTRYTTSPVEQALLISAALGPFLEATSGFGIGIVIAAPLYLELGFESNQVALLSLLTQSAVPWGALAVGTVLNAELSLVSLHALGIWSALLSIPLFLFYTVAVVVIAGGVKAVRGHLVSILTSWGLLSFFTWFANAFLSTQVAGVVAGLIAAFGLLLFWQVLHRVQAKAGIGQTAAAVDPVQSHSLSKRSLSNDTLSGRTIFKSLLPYGVLLAFLFASNWIPPFREWLQEFLVIRVSSFQYQLDLLYNPGFALLLASVVAVFTYRLHREQLGASLLATAKQVYPAALSTMGFVAMSTVMQQAGMIHVIAQNAAMLFGTAFIAISPLIGGLGGFITGSNSAANAMLAPFQSAMSHKLHTSTLVYATAQNVSASNMTMASPSRVALAAAISGQSGREGDLTRRILPLSLTVLLVVTVCSILMQRFV